MLVENMTRLVRFMSSRKGDCFLLGCFELSYLKNLLNVRYIKFRVNEILLLNVLHKNFFNLLTELCGNGICGMGYYYFIEDLCMRQLFNMDFYFSVSGV